MRVGVELGRALCFGLCYGLLCGIWAVLRILFCALGFGVELGGLLVLDCIRNFGVGFGRCFVFGIIVLVFGRCFVFCGFGRLSS